MSHLSQRPADPVVGESHHHESAFGHVTGAALYTDDLVGRLTGVLHAYPVQSEHAHASLDRVDAAPAYEVPGVVRVITAADVPGVNDQGVKHDEPMLPTDEVMFFGQPVAWVLGEDLEAAKAGAAAVVVDATPLPSLITVRDAIAAGSYHGVQPVIDKGDVDGAFADAAHVFSGEFEFAGQEHFYLETQASLAHVDESGQVFIQCSTQHPTETQDIVSHVLGIPANEVTVQCLRMGGGFGGKEMQPHGYAALAALGAKLTGRPVRLRLSRTQDMTMTGKRHGFHSTWRIGLTEDGRILALDATLTADGGWSLDLSEPVLTRAMCHIDNAYWVPNIRVHGRVAKCHKTSQTAFRGFGGPQGVIVAERIIEEIAYATGQDTLAVRKANFYTDGQLTPYHQPVENVILPQLIGELEGSCDYAARRRAVLDWNARMQAAGGPIRRGIALTPVKFGISFTATHFNQAGALVHIYTDGSIMLNHGGCEMGQGLHTKIVQVVAEAFNVGVEQVRITKTTTEKVPNTSATAASSASCGAPPCCEVAITCPFLIGGIRFRCIYVPAARRGARSPSWIAPRACSPSHNAHRRGACHAWGCLSR